MMEEERTVRNLVLSICEFRLQVAPPSPQPAKQTAGRVPGGRVGSQLLLVGAVGPNERGGATQLLMHGGADETQCYDDLHAIELERGLWRELSVGGFSKPSGVYGHSMRAWNDKIVLFGGLAAQTAQDLAEAGQPQTFPSPSFMGPQSTQWLHNPQPSNSLFLLQVDGLFWTQPEVEGEGPTPRAFHGATICKDFLVVFGGATDARLQEVGERISWDVWVATVGLSKDGRTVTVVLTSPLQPCNDLHLLDLNRNTWYSPAVSLSPPAKKRRAGEGVEQEPPPELGSPQASSGAGAGDETDARPLIKVSGVAPSPRIGHAMITVKQTEKILLFGGAADDNNLYCLDFQVYRRPKPGVCASRRSVAADGEDDEIAEMSLSWSRIETHRTGPVSRGFFTFAQVGPGRLFVFGGQPLTGASPDASSPADLYVLNLKTHQWQKPLYEGQLSLRAEAAAVLHDKLIVFGGARVSPKAQAPSAPPADGQSEASSHPPKPDALGDEAASALASVLGVGSSCRVSKKLFFLNVLEIKEGSADGEFKFKLVTVGDSGVGKSCLLMRFVQDQYSAFHVSTIGVDFKSVLTMVKGKVCTLQLWDTAGQERFSGVTGNYYRNADCFILVFDMTRRSSFLHIDNWIKQIKEHHECGPSTMMLLIGNKADLTASLQVTEREAQQCADQIGAIYISTSAKTSANVDAAFLAAAAKLVEMRRRAAAAHHASASASASAPAAGGPSPGPVPGISLLSNALSAQPGPRRGLCAGCMGSSVVGSQAPPALREGDEGRQGTSVSSAGRNVAQETASSANGAGHPAPQASLPVQDRLR
ncbi:putative Ras family domain-containing protein [Neospora caninum Liverpool]|uniref:Putative Ras family domain-containing protein n=1 Tax=Neospora caninum (strain Liverpool) TaxID=572307 RepID=F0VQW5_NEOCL|nr:putative Ras family domain-containing protein [Neospora caninum Liverpool]CBZ56112.1 putative Ras family domain-containing protein [Neospora caninum Liverpool]CEL70867.1 TPA: Ras family domain-containing protein, putative [Neospora caninum Liverpool]|eukprot:XP_003886138.1 putative Ras family domain-containing protein [Neospora caninum Liverpool]